MVIEASTTTAVMGRIPAVGGRNGEGWMNPAVGQVWMIGYAGMYGMRGP